MTEETDLSGLATLQLGAQDHDNFPGPLHPDLTLQEMAVLAREMAMAIRDPAIIMHAVGLTQAQFDRFIMPHPSYKRLYEQYVIEWESALSTQRRISIESAAALEDLLPTLAARLHRETEDLGKTVEGAKLLAKLAGIGEAGKGDGGSAERFTITINLGSDVIKLEETRGAIPGGLEIQSQSETLRLSEPLRTSPQGESNPTPV